MKIVKQVFAEWIGVMDEEAEVVDNGSIIFTLDGLRRSQLKPYDPTQRELNELHRRLVENKSRYVEYVGGLLCMKNC